MNIKVLAQPRRGGALQGLVVAALLAGAVSVMTRNPHGEYQLPGLTRPIGDPARALRRTGRRDCDRGPTAVALLRKIDCVMLRVDDLTSAWEFYERTLGLEPLWSDTCCVRTL